METVLPVRRLDVEALESVGVTAGFGAVAWRRDWPVLRRRLPEAVRITMGRGLPVVFAVSPLAIAQQ